VDRRVSAAPEPAQRRSRKFSQPSVEKKGFNSHVGSASGGSCMAGRGASKLLAIVSLALAGCGVTPGCRAISTGMLGAGTGAAIAAIAGGPVGLGAAIGGVTGVVGGAVTPPQAAFFGPSPFCY